MDAPQSDSVSKAVREARAAIAHRHQRKPMRELIPSLAATKRATFIVCTLVLTLSAFDLFLVTYTASQIAASFQLYVTPDPCVVHHLHDCSHPLGHAPGMGFVYFASALTLFTRPIGAFFFGAGGELVSGQPRTVRFNGAPVDAILRGASGRRRQERGVAMIERLRRALEHVEDLSPAMQEEIAAQIEEMTESLEDVAAPGHTVLDYNLPRSVRDALAMVGAWRDLQDDDEFEALDRIRHESAPTPPIDLDDL